MLTRAISLGFECSAIRAASTTELRLPDSHSRLMTRLNFPNSLSFTAQVVLI